MKGYGQNLNLYETCYINLYYKFKDKKENYTGKVKNSLKTKLKILNHLN